MYNPEGKRPEHSHQAGNPAPHHLTMDTSALISLSESTAHGTEFINMMRFLAKERGVKLCFSDQTVFELTGLLPESQKQLLKEKDKLGLALDGQPALEREAMIEKLIGRFVDNSSRICTRYRYMPDRERRNKAFLKMFLQPDGSSWIPAAELNDTAIGKQFGERTAAEIEMAAGYIGEHVDHYRISCADALTFARDDFKVGDLRLTRRAAHHLGWLSVEDLKRQGEYQRHVTLDEMKHYLKLPDDHPLVKEIEKRRGQYILLGDLIKHHLLTEPGETSGQERVVEELGRVWKLTLGDMFHSGLLPKESLLEVAGAIGFPVPCGKMTQTQAIAAQLLVPEWEEHLIAHCRRKFSDNVAALAYVHDFKRRFQREGIDIKEIAEAELFAPEKIWSCFKEPLGPTGFFERHLTIGDAKRIAALDDNRIPHFLPVISQLSSAHAISKAHREEFEARCRDMLPYEKVFSEALINGAITIKEFLSICQKSGTLFSDHDRYRTRDPHVQDISIRYDHFRPEATEIQISSKGILARAAANTALGQNIRLSPLQGKRLTFPLHELLGAAKKSMYEIRSVPPNKKYHRLFSALLLPAVRENASNVREMARSVLGDERLRQMESDFATKHHRVLVKQMHRKPYADPYTVFYANTRADQWDLGELAVIDMALARPEAHWTIINTDSELKNTLANRMMNPELMRKKPGYRDAIEQNIRKFLTHPDEKRLRNMTKEEFLDRLALVAFKDVPRETRLQRAEHYSFMDMLVRRFQSQETKLLAVLLKDTPEPGRAREEKRLKSGLTPVRYSPEEFRLEDYQKRLTELLSRIGPERKDAAFKHYDFLSSCLQRGEAPLRLFVQRGNEAGGMGWRERVALSRGGEITASENGNFNHADRKQRHKVRPEDPPASRVHH